MNLISMPFVFRALEERPFCFKTFWGKVIYIFFKTLNIAWILFQFFMYGILIYMNYIKAESVADFGWWYLPIAVAAFKVCDFFIKFAFGVLIMALSTIVETSVSVYNAFFGRWR